MFFRKVLLWAVLVTFYLTYLGTLGVSVAESLVLQNHFPNYMKVAESIDTKYTSIVSNMARSLDNLTNSLDNLEPGLDFFNQIYLQFNSSSKQIGYNTTNSLFDQVRELLNIAELTHQKIIDFVNQTDLQSIYDLYIDPILPDANKCKDECYQWLHDYNRMDIFEKQLNLITECKNLNGKSVSNCLTHFESTGYNFLTYFANLYEEQGILMSLISDWKDITMPFIANVISTRLQPFQKQLTDEVAPYFLTHFESRYKKYIIPILIAAILSLLLVCIMLTWLFKRYSWIMAIQFLNALLLCALAIIIGDFIGYSAFLESSIRHFVQFFGEKYIESPENTIFHLFDCRCKYTGDSINLSSLTSGKEYSMNSIMQYFVNEVRTDMLLLGLSFTSPITLIAMENPENESFPYIPYYAIDDSTFNTLSTTSIVSDPHFQTFATLYSSNSKTLENNIIRLYQSESVEFDQAYTELFGENGSCNGYSFSKIDECVSDANDPNYQYLIHMPVVKSLSNLQEIQNALIHFSRYGYIAQHEYDLINLMILISKNLLPQISNIMASMYQQLLNVFGSFDQFYLNESLYLGNYQYLQNLINQSCMPLQDELLSFSNRILYPISDNSNTLFIFLFVSIIMSVVISILNMIYKIFVGKSTSSSDSSEYSLSNVSDSKSSIPDTSSEETFNQNDAINIPTVSENVKSTSSHKSSELPSKTDDNITESTLQIEKIPTNEIIPVYTELSMIDHNEISPIPTDDEINSSGPYKNNMCLPNNNNFPTDFNQDTYPPHESSEKIDSSKSTEDFHSSSEEGIFSNPNQNVFQTPVEYDVNAILQNSPNLDLDDIP